MLYYDDLETCNPLGSRATKHKLGAFYYTLGNIRPTYRSSIKAIQLLCLCKTAMIKKYGMNEVLRPFITDLQKLEQDEGYPFSIKGTEKRFRGTIAYASADNPGSQSLGGFKEGCSAHCMCRHCLGLQEEIKSKFHEKYFTLRTPQSYEDHCAQISTYGEYFSKAYGINRRSVLNDSRFFNVVGGLPTDVMHDILEGTLHYKMKEMLKEFIKVQAILTLEDLNGRIAKFDFGYYNDKNKPSPITEQKLSSNDHSLKQHAVQMWCLAIHLPQIIGNLISPENTKWKLFLKLLEITAICLSPVVSQEQIAYLQVLIEEHHSEFCHLYPESSIIPKMHFMIHMPSVMLSLGPLARSWCMRYEAKHHYFKKLSTIIGNFTNLPYTLAMRHQQWISYKLNSSGNYESSFLEKGIEIGPGDTVSAGDLLYYNTLKQAQEQLEHATNVRRPKWISVHGTIYKKGCVIWTGHDEEEMPIFAIVKEICIAEENLRNAWLVTEQLLTSSYNPHFNAYEVEVQLSQELVLQKQEDLIYGFPLHLIHITLEDQVKVFVCPKYQIPPNA
ncbi:uncharacterized protein LOC114530067 [Dendronephthya gigantea]|uniref:uncharacterized protein LOC114530067 n=1 Tax=Dendronephthya gigantea TaxID=151771 RepID=UPI00106CB2D8|nr:uncharacterized protein LOC114530067 [Dendronephthya gigantea]